MISLISIGKKLPGPVKWGLLGLRGTLKGTVCGTDVLFHPKLSLYYCPCCGHRLRRFQKGSYTRHPERYALERYEGIRQDILCPVCMSLPRHRILASWCERNIDALRECRILYFAPEYSMTVWLKRKGIPFVTADLFQAADLRIDIANTGQPDGSWDVVFCNHVLEHVPDFHSALQEVYRILRPGGRLICSFPVDRKLKSVLEAADSGYMPEKEYKRVFGQVDHLRVFGRDSERVLKEAGFQVKTIEGEHMADEILPVIGPADYDSNTLFLCEKPVSFKDSANPKVSVVIPVYNVLPYLNQCLESVLSQSWANLEIILVDDGSTDGSGECCDLWAGKDRRVSVIHQENHGLSAARNAGLKLVSGDYILFVDSDDYIHRDMVKRMVSAAEKEDAEVVVCGYRTIPRLCKHTWKKPAFPVLGKFAASLLMRGHPAGLMVWNKLYRRDLLLYLHFDEGHVYEGKVPMLRAMIHSGRVVFIPDMLYYYRSRREGITHTITLANEIDRIRSAKQVEELIRQQAPELLKDSKKLSCCMVIYSKARMAKSRVKKNNKDMIFDTGEYRKKY